jgi:hypothetical protein
MCHDEPGSGIVRCEIRQQEQVIRELQQPILGRPVRVEKTKNTLVVGKGISVIGSSPPPGEGGNGEHHLAMVEGQLKDCSILNRTIHPPDVLGIGLIHLLATADVGVFRGEVRRRDRCFHLPLAKITKPGVEREHVVQRCSPCTGQTEDYERAEHGMSRFGGVIGIPMLNAETPAEAGDEKGLDPVDSFLVLTNIRSEGLDQATQAVLPVTGSKLGQTGLFVGTLDEPVNGDAHGAPFWSVRRSSGFTHSNWEFGRIESNVEVRKAP